MTNIDNFNRAERRVALLAKDNMMALCSLNVEGEKAFVVTLDPRDDEPKIGEVQTVEQAVEQFTDVLSISEIHGWTICYNGGPLWG